MVRYSFPLGLFHSLLHAGLVHGYNPRTIRSTVTCPYAFKKWNRVQTLNKTIGFRPPQPQRNISKSIS
jgi:hypothetical protein